MINSNSITSISFTMFFSSFRRAFVSDRAFVFDIFEALFYQRVDLLLSDFVMIFAIWTKIANFTRVIYNSFLEIFRLFSSLNTLNELFETFDIFKIRSRVQLSLLFLRFQKVKIEREQQFNLSVTFREKSKKNTQNLIFFDFIFLMSRLLFSQIFSSKQHRDMTKIVDKSTEFYHFLSWNFSIRFTFDVFVLYLDKFLIFLSNFLNFELNDILHLNRLTFVNRNMRNSIAIKSKVTMYVQEIIQIKSWQNFWTIFANDTTFNDISLETNELLLLENRVHYILEKHVRRWKNDVYNDWIFDDFNENFYFSDMFKKRYFVRKILNVDQQKIRTFNLFASVRNELEIATFDRQYFTMIFFHRRTNMIEITDQFARECVSMSFFMFLNEFELFKNAYRSIMNVYIISAILNYRKRNRRANCLILTLKFHEVKLVDVVEILIETFAKLDKNLLINIQKKKKIVCVYIKIFIENMFQQHYNKKLIIFAIIYDCNFCFIIFKKRADLSFDIYFRKRYHFSILNYREKIDRRNAIATIKKKFLNVVDMLEYQTSFIQFIFAFDIIRSRSANMTHSEFRDLNKMTQELLFTIILFEKSQFVYLFEFQIFSFFFSWLRIQFSKRHLKIWSMSKTNRVIIITSVLLRCWFRKKHFDTRYRRTAQRVFSHDMIEHNITIIDVIVKCYVCLVENNVIIIAFVIRVRTNTIMFETRSIIQKLFETTRQTKSTSTIKNFSRSRITSMNSMISVITDHRNKSNNIKNDFRTEFVENDLLRKNWNDENISKQTQLFQKLKKRFNMHVKLHYENVMKKFAFSSNCDTFFDENKHRYVHFQENWLF